MTSIGGSHTPLCVSIIISNYNYGRFLSVAIDSALEQTYQTVEVIVVDDGSTDNSREVIESYGDRITALFQENGKQAAALNNGLQVSKGDIVIFLDADDYLFPYAAERIIAVWTPKIAKVHYRLEVVDSEQKSLGYSYPQGKDPLASGEVWKTLLEKGVYQRTPMSGNALSRQAIADIFPIPDEYKLTADDYLCILVPFNGQVEAIEESLGAYRIHGNNQWALTRISGDRFRRFVRHDLQNCNLLIEKATSIGYDVPDDIEQRSIGRLWSRIISLRLDPQNHPIETDTSTELTYQCVRSLWKYSSFSNSKRVFYTVWALWVGLLPVFLAEPAITWLYAPHLRPKAISKAVERLKAVTS